MVIRIMSSKLSRGPIVMLWILKLPPPSKFKIHNMTSYWKISTKYVPSPPMYDDHEYDVERFKRRLVNTDTASNVTIKPHRSMDLEETFNKINTSIIMIIYITCAAVIGNILYSENFQSALIYSQRILITAGYLIFKVAYFSIFEIKSKK